MADSRRVLDVAALAAVEDQLVAVERERGRLHAQALRLALDLARIHRAAGMELLTVPALGLSLGCSEQRAQQVFTEAGVLSVLDGGLAAVEDGLLSVEGSRAVAELLGPVDAEPRAEAWARLLVRLRADAEQGAPRPVARLRETLRRTLERVDAEGVAARRAEVAKATTDVTRRTRDDGLVDLFATGLPAADALVVEQRLMTAAEVPWAGSEDLTVGQRKVRMLVDVLLGRTRLTADGHAVPVLCPGDGLTRSGAACGCLPGSAAPCGAEVVVLLPLGAGLGTTEEVAELAGHGPLSSGDTQALLRNRPRLHAAWVDAEGVPVAAADSVLEPGEGPQALRDALLALQALPPPVVWQPRHPDDHAPSRSDQSAVARARPRARPRPRQPAADAAPPELLTHPHPPDTPGPYRPSTRMRRFLRLRAPRCEWPGCGARASRCDDEHDLAHPEGPTCPCNLGPLCRRHHRCKQAGLHKRRNRQAGVTWTSPTGRTWTSPAQHEPPEQPTRPVQPLPGQTFAERLAEGLDLGPLALQDELDHQEHLALLDAEG